MTILLLVLMSWGAHAQHDHATHADKKADEKTPVFKDENLGKAYYHYIQLKDALVASNDQEAKKAAGNLQSALTRVDKKASDEAAKVATAVDLKAQRLAFTELSSQMASLVKEGQLSEGVIYLEYCPMANGGSYWLSNEKEILNPYFGKSMLRCGSVEKTIE